jgi:hypothetical protein
MMTYDVLTMDRRQRAPRRVGHRTTLTVPAELLEQAERLAQEWGTTANDALIRLAEEAADGRARRREIDALAAKRRAAVDAPIEIGGDGEFLSPDEFRAAVLAERGGA